MRHPISSRNAINDLYVKGNLVYIDANNSQRGLVTNKCPAKTIFIEDNVIYSGLLAKFYNTLSSVSEKLVIINNIFRGGGYDVRDTNTELFNKVFVHFLNFGIGYNYNNIIGSSANRPSDDITKGAQYFDETLGKPIYWNGTAWIDATGATV